MRGARSRENLRRLTAAINAQSDLEVSVRRAEVSGDVDQPTFRGYPLGRAARQVEEDIAGSL